jgi:hypothetical protein
VLHIYDFYNLYLLDYCEVRTSPLQSRHKKQLLTPSTELLYPSTFSNSSSTPTKNVTRCSNHTAFFNFNLSAILQSELLPDITLADLDWPSKLDDALTAVGVLSKAMFALYCIGAGFAGLAVLVVAYALCGGWLGVHLGFVTDVVRTSANFPLTKPDDLADESGVPDGIPLYDSRW